MHHNHWQSAEATRLRTAAAGSFTHHPLQLHYTSAVFWYHQLHSALTGCRSQRTRRNALWSMKIRNARLFQCRQGQTNYLHSTFIYSGRFKNIIKLGQDIIIPGFVKFKVCVKNTSEQKYLQLIFDIFFLMTYVINFTLIRNNY